jgi:hydrogenase maturation protease
MTSAPRLLVLGLGNDLLSDDAVGLHLARRLARRLARVPGIEVQETAEMGLSLLDVIVGFDRLMVVDAVQTGRAAPGSLHEFAVDELKLLPAMSPHFLGLGEVLALGRELGLVVPRQVRIFAVEVQDPWSVGTRLTRPVREAMPAVASRILTAARTWSDELQPLAAAASREFV